MDCLFNFIITNDSFLAKKHFQATKQELNEEIESIDVSAFNPQQFFNKLFELWENKFFYPNGRKYLLFNAMSCFSKIISFAQQNKPVVNNFKNQLKQLFCTNFETYKNRIFIAIDFCNDNTTSSSKQYYIWRDIYNLIYQIFGVETVGSKWTNVLQLNKYSFIGQSSFGLNSWYHPVKFLQSSYESYAKFFGNTTNLNPLDFWRIYFYLTRGERFFLYKSFSKKFMLTRLMLDYTDYQKLDNEIFKIAALPVTSNYWHDIENIVNPETTMSIDVIAKAFLEQKNEDTITKCLLYTNHEIDIRRIIYSIFSKLFNIFIFKIFCSDYDALINSQNTNSQIKWKKYFNCNRKDEFSAKNIPLTLSKHKKHLKPQTTLLTQAEIKKYHFAYLANFLQQSTKHHSKKYLLQQQYHFFYGFANNVIEELFFKSYKKLFSQSQSLFYQNIEKLLDVFIKLPKIESEDIACFLAGII